MALEFRGRNLIPGEHGVAWEEFVATFASSPYRQQFIPGLQSAIHHLREFGCQRVFVDGSYVTKSETPGDYDCCWDPTGVDLAGLKRQHPVFFNFANERLAQKTIYRGEFFPMDATAEPIRKTPYRIYFQRDKRTGKPKGIVVLRTEEVP